MNAALAESGRIEFRTTTPRAVALHDYEAALRRFSRHAVDPGPATLEDLCVLQPHVDRDVLAGICDNRWGVSFYEMYAPGCLVKGMTHRLRYVPHPPGAGGTILVDPDDATGSFRVAGEALLASAYATWAWGAGLHDARALGGKLEFHLIAPDEPFRHRLVFWAALRRPVTSYLKTVTQSSGMPDLTFELVHVTDNPIAGDEIATAVGALSMRGEPEALHNCFQCGGFFDKAGCACCGRRWPSWYQAEDKVIWLAAPVPKQVYHAVERSTGRKLEIARTFLLQAQKRSAARRIALALLEELRGRRDKLLGNLTDPAIARMVADYLPALSDPLVLPDERHPLARRRPPGLGYVMQPEPTKEDDP